MHFCKFFTFFFTIIVSYCKQFVGQTQEHDFVVSLVNKLGKLFRYSMSTIKKGKSRRFFCLACSFHCKERVVIFRLFPV